MGIFGSKQNKYISFEGVDCRQALSGGEHAVLLINTLSENLQSCLIVGTVVAAEEEETINHLISYNDYDHRIVVYGENCMDESVERKYAQLTKLGFSNVRIYRGGLFEWLLLQDIYGADKFPTTAREKDILKFRGSAK